MPYGKYTDSDSQICIYKQDADGNRIGERLGCHATENEADAQLAALYASENMTVQLPAEMNLDTRYYTGGAIRAAGDGIIEGYLVPFNTPDNPDFYGTYFDTQTDYMLNDYPVLRAFILYNHGLDETLNVRTMGTFLRAKIDDIGLWVQAQLNMRDEWEQEVYKLAQAGKLGWSSGALPQAVDVADDGHIKCWPIIEGSLTPAPAAVPFASQIYTRSSYQAALNSAKDGVTREEPSGATPVSNTLSNDKQLKNQELRTMADNKRNLADVATMLQQVLAALMEYVNMEAGEGGEAMPPEVQEEMQNEMQTQMSARLADMEAQLKDMRPEQIRSLLEEQAIEMLPGVVEQYQKDKAARDKQMRAAAKKAFQQIEPTPAPGYVRGNGNGNGSMSVSEPRRYWPLNLQAMMFVQRVMKSRGQAVSDDFMQTLAGRTAMALEKKDALVYNPHVRSVLPATRADEIVTSTNSGNGDEWIGVAYDSELWEKARHNRVYQELQGMGMRVVEVPQGYESTVIFTESSDPTVYTITQSADLDATSRPTVVVPVTAPGTGQVTLTPGYLGMAIAYTSVFEEDSLIAAAPQLNEQMNEKAEETIEQLFINGDTEAGTTNVNYDGSSAAAITAYYKASNGARKYALVTGSSTSRSGGTLDENDFRLTLALFPTEIQARQDKIAFIVDMQTHNTALDILAAKTQDVRGTNATIDTGLLNNLYGVSVLRSGFLPLTASDGKVTYNATGTLGQILAIYAPYWAMGWKRRITLETQKDILAQTNLIVATFRLGFLARGAGASVESYNLTIA
jgi:phage head maturation protease